MIDTLIALVAADPEADSFVAATTRLENAVDDPAAESVLLAALAKLPTLALATAREKGINLVSDATFGLEAVFVVIARLVRTAIFTLAAENAANLALIVASEAAAPLEAERIFTTDLTIVAAFVFAAARMEKAERAR